MASVSTYLLFKRETEAAFNFYKSVFGTQFLGDISRHGDVPTPDGQPELSAADKNLIINMQLPILGGHLLMGTDTSGAMDFPLVQGNNFSIALHPDSRQESDTLFTTLAENGTITTPLQEMFWGDYYGTLIDQFGVHWMINCESKT